MAKVHADRGGLVSHSTVCSDFLVFPISGSGMMLLFRSRDADNRSRFISLVYMKFCFNLFSFYAFMFRYISRYLYILIAVK